MAAPKFNPVTMDIFTKKGRDLFDKYLKEKKEWENKGGVKKVRRRTTRKKT